MKNIILSLTIMLVLLFPAVRLFALEGAPVSTQPHHWERPVSISGGGDVLEQTKTYYPDKCAKCHPTKFKDWSGSLHSASFSPGLLAQLDPELRPDFTVSCYYCHAPAVEQSEIVTTNDGGGRRYKNNALFDTKLQQNGVTCAVCHLRGGGVVGPGNTRSTSNKLHHSARQAEIFKSARFCAACHQMNQGFKVNGKVLTNTYNEWKQSSYAKNNVTCQVCHMPGRRHLFRGIHDPDMVAKGLDIKVMRVPASKGVKAVLMVKNARIGHMFPTYVTPIVVLKAFLEDKDGKALEGSLTKSFIGRLLSQDLKIEYFDTRLAPFETFKFNFESIDTGLADRLVFEIVVRPDEFYNRFFERVSVGHFSGFKEKELGEALKKTRESPYLLYRKELVL